ncbi:MAG: efflux RND transporter periplasmic adaptor subunit, partial [Polaromonas sp.]|nr:efflux RND transporter periplasmic adaptor subunit [Polaromonas sp.]
MNKKYLIAALIAAGVLGAAGYGLYALGMKNGGSMAATATPSEASPTLAATPAGPQSVAEGEEATRRHISAGLKAGDTDPVSGRKILYYQDPMMPGSKFDKPAKSPFMDMMLAPVYADSDSDQGKVTVSSRI